VIGVVAPVSEHAVIREFFQLFKTAWEFFEHGRDYDVVLCSGCPPIETSARLIVVYAGRDAFSATEKIKPSEGSVVLCSSQGDRIPIYGSCLAFPDSRNPLLMVERDGSAASLETRSREQQVVWLGYGLFYEIEFLLTDGQPACHARIPTLELHIKLLRHLIVSASVPLAEIPPVPAGYKFIACLTHDVDHPCFRNHFLDGTAFGFLYRATAGSLVDMFRGRRTVKQMLLNWCAALSTPLVYLRLRSDIWRSFIRYTEMEGKSSSTFFVIPKRNDSGVALGARKAPRRAAKYNAMELSEELRFLGAAGCEIGVHGIDAWHDTTAGREELEAIASITGATELGVRMHWLYFAHSSPATLEQAGFSYDSSLGYNETVGYRSGTVQVYKPLSTARMLQLPLHIMDTALFYPDRLDLSPEKASQVADELIANATRLGGVLTINWHDRSIAPERLWDDFYKTLLATLKDQGAWITSARNAVAWFRKRREAVFQEGSESSRDAGETCRCEETDGLPGLDRSFYNRAPVGRDSTNVGLEAAISA
jgi:hypothetical protein